MNKTKDLKYETYLEELDQDDHGDGSIALGVHCKNGGDDQAEVECQEDEAWLDEPACKSTHEAAKGKDSVTNSLVAKGADGGPGGYVSRLLDWQ